MSTAVTDKSFLGRLGEFGVRLVKEFGIYLAFLIFFLYLSISSPHFLTMGNLFTIMRQVAVSGVMACGLTMVLIQGDIDLSFGSLLTVVGLCAAIFSGAKTIYGSIMNLSLIAAFAITLLIGIAAELVNGLIITRIRINPFIVTLGTMTILKGAGLVISSGQSIFSLKEKFTAIGLADVAGIPLIFLIFLLVAALCWFILKKTPLGRHIYAIGGNVQAAYLSGVPIARTRLAVFGLMGALTVLAGILLTSRLNSATPLAGDPYLMDVIAACVIGGTSLAGGIGGIPGTILGVIFLGIINNGLNLLGITSAYQYIAKGLIIVVAVIIDATKLRVEGQYVK